MKQKGELDTIMYLFRVEGFPLQRPDWRVIYCNGWL